eukprot:9582204-Alexandrium_andersonii.AAC.1
MDAWPVPQGFPRPCAVQTCVRNEFMLRRGCLQRWRRQTVALERWGEHQGALLGPSRLSGFRGSLSCPAKRPCEAA